jgi:4-amino-4-deoxy-L-arabinose transferase-like glycosyltransferase
MNQRSLTSLLPAALLGIVAFTLVLIITEPPGPGLDPDALQYMGAAESLAAHLEYRVPTAEWASADSTSPLAHFPPGFSTALALPVRLGLAPMQAARLVEALAAGVTVTVLVLLVGGATTPLAGILAAVALFAMDAMHEVHVSVLSEPLFLACLALTLAAMVHAPDRPLRAGVPAALGALTRYAGLSLVGAVALWQLFQRAPLTTRLRRAVVAVLPALVLQGMWVLRTRRMAGSMAIRRFAAYTSGLRATLAQGGATLAGWLVPDHDASSEPMSHHGWLALAVGVVVLAFVIAGARRARRLARTTADDDAPSTAWRLIAASLVLTVCYAGMLLVSRLLADPAIPLDNRLLAPVLFLATTIVATTIALWWRASHSTLARVAVAGALLCWWGASAAVTYDDAEYALEQGSDFAGEQWQRSEVLAWARTNGTTYPLYTNWSAAPYFHLHRPSRLLPLRNDTRALAAFPDTLRVRNGRALVFNVAGEEYATAEQLAGLRGLRVVARLKDGIVLAAVERRP